MDAWIVWLALAVMTIAVIYTNVAFWRKPKAEREAINKVYAEHTREWTP